MSKEEEEVCHNLTVLPVFISNTYRFLDFRIGRLYSVQTSFF